MRSEPTSQLKLLLVEDDASVLAALRMFLKSDYEIHSASTVSAGINLFKTLQPALVLLDLRLPDGDGLNALREIRLISATAPVIILTGYASMGSIEESLRLGASDFLHKPFKGFELKSRIDQLTGRNAPPPPPKTPEENEEQKKKELTELEYRANASAMFLHDAAGPVTTAMTAAQFLNEAITASPDHFDQSLHKMSKLLCDAMNLISGLFEQSRSIEQLCDMVATEVPVLKILGPTIDLLRPKIRSRDITMNVEGKLEHTRLRVNHLALIRVLSNLLHNAIDAVEDNTGRVNLTMNLEKKWVEFTIQDNGSGIPPQYMEKIFEAHFTTKPEGTGMGLYICKHLIDSMEGMLTVRNEPGHGCCFSVKIPR